MEAINLFLKKEQEYNMFDRELFNIKYWEFVRAIVSCEVNSVVGKSSKMFAKPKVNLKKYIINIKNINKYFLAKKNVDILFVSHPRRVMDNGKFKNNYVDYYIDFLKEKYNILTIEEPIWSSFGVTDNAHDFPLYTNDIYLTDIHEIAFKFKKVFFKLFCRKKYKKIINEYNEIHNIINSWYEIDSINVKKYFVDSLVRLILDRKYISKLVKKINPKIIMLHYIPTIFKEMLIYECNKRNIPTIEVQHGTITKVDPCVNKCLDVSKLEVDNKYNKLPKNVNIK